MCLRQRAAEDGKILGEDVNDAAVDGAPAGDHAVARDLDLFHAEVGAAMLHVHVELLEGIFVHEKLDALARGELAAPVLRLDAGTTAADTRFRSSALQLVENFLHVGGLIATHKLMRGIARGAGPANRAPRATSTVKHAPSR